MPFSFFNEQKLCPWCLSFVNFKLSADSLQTGGDDGLVIEAKQRFATYRCTEQSCRDRIVPRMYVEDFREFPPVIINAIGYRAHGKSVFFASTFAAFDDDSLANQWPKFTALPINQTAIERIEELGHSLSDEGLLPPASQKEVLPEPTLIRVTGTPLRFPCTLLVYDTSGEAFEKPAEIGEYARFVRRSETALLFIRLQVLKDGRVARKMKSLLESYILGMRTMGANTRDQNLIVTYTAADELYDDLLNWPQLVEYVKQGALDNLGQTDYAERMSEISDMLYDYTANELKAKPFLSLAYNNFNEIRFSMISSLGHEPVLISEEDEEKRFRLNSKLASRRVLDPLLWAIDLSRYRSSLSRPDRR